MTDHPPLPTPAEWAELCAAADQRPRGERLSVVGLLARIRELEEGLADIAAAATQDVRTGHSGPLLLQIERAARALLAPSPGAGGAEETL